MKKLFSTSLYLSMFLSVCTSNVYAGGGFTGGSTLAYQIIQDATNLGTRASTFVNTAANVQDMIKNTVLDPIANGLINIALQQASNDILSWANGGFNGDPLIIANPEEYIKSAGLNQVRIGLGAIPQGALGDSIWATLYSQYSGSTNLTDQLQGLANSNIPTMVQNSLCTTDALTARATQDLQSSSASYTQADITARINDIYNYACVGDPRTDTQLATRLTDLNQQDSSIMGLKGLAAVTSSENNAYLRTMKAREYTDLAAAEQKRLAENEIYFGAGAVSEKRCIEYETTPQNGRPPLCLRTETITPGKAVQASIDKANTAGIDRLANIQGAGSLGAILTSFATTFIMNGINQALSSSSGGSNPNNAPVTVSSVRPVVQDLTNDQTRRSELLAPMLSQLTYYRTSLTALDTTDRAYLADLSAYEVRVQSIRNCPSAAAIYTNRQNRINTTRASLVAELANIATANQLVTDTTTRLNASNSSQEVSSIFNAYQLRVESERLPALSADAERNGQYITAKSDSSNDTALTDAQTTCAQAQQQVQTQTESSLGNTTP